MNKRRTGVKNPKLSASLKGNKNAAKGGAVTQKVGHTIGKGRGGPNALTLYQEGLFGRKMQVGSNYDAKTGATRFTGGLPRNAWRIKTYRLPPGHKFTS
jgi:hypothetical protein